MFTDNVVQQYFQVQLIREGENPVVQQMPLDAGNAGRLTIDPLEVGDRLIVAVGSLADKTRQPASYTLSVDLAN